jgi:hypothetical protein
VGWKIVIDQQWNNVACASTHAATRQNKTKCHNNHDNDEVVEVEVVVEVIKEQAIEHAL